MWQGKVYFDSCYGARATPKNKSVMLLVLVRVGRWSLIVELVVELVDEFQAAQPVSMLSIRSRN